MRKEHIILPLIAILTLTCGASAAREPGSGYEEWKKLQNENGEKRADKLHEVLSCQLFFEEEKALVLECGYFVWMDDATLDDYVREINGIYNDPENRNIKIYQAQVLATIKMRNEDSNDYENLIKLYREGKNLPYRVRARKVLDGDTIIAADGNGDEYKIRLIGIDTPEMDKKGGEEAKLYLEALLGDNELTLRYFKDIFDKYGRILAEVHVETNGEALNTAEELLRSKHASPFFYRDEKRPKGFSEGFEERYELWAKE